MADQPTTPPTITCVHAIRLEDGRVLQSHDEHELHALELAITDLDASAAPAVSADVSTTEGPIDG